jgi:plastocyanin
MRRTALAAACLCLAAVLLLPAGGGAATPCVAWKKHHKRVVKYVKRDGKRKKVVRVKRWPTCAKRAAPAAPGSGPAVMPPVAPPTAEPPPEPEDPTIPRLGVRAEDTPDLKYTLSKPELPAGEVIVELQNQGEDPHNLNLQPEGGGSPEGRIDTVGPKSQSKARWTLPAGTYRLWCDLDGHEAAGMSATLVVTE